MRQIRARGVRPGDVVRNGLWLDVVTDVEAVKRIDENGELLVRLHLNNGTASRCMSALDWIEVQRN